MGSGTTRQTNKCKICKEEKEEMNKEEIKLTAKEWKLVGEQCAKCVYWCDRCGCSFADACDEYPAEGCAAIKEK